MPRQNRVNPFGDIIATSERGMFMGNRGILHDDSGRIRRQWVGNRWIICLLEFKGRKRQLMTPGQYTQLFFLDEATALAAGHRPCAECRRDRFNAFRKSWQKSRGDASPPTADDVDRQLHAERVAPDRSRRSFLGNLNDMANGVFVRHESWGADPFLVWNRWLLRWTSGGYLGQAARPDNLEVEVLTPESTVKAIRAGYLPEIHASRNAAE